MLAPPLRASRGLLGGGPLPEDLLAGPGEASPAEDAFLHFSPEDPPGEILSPWTSPGEAFEPMESFPGPYALRLARALREGPGPGPPFPGEDSGKKLFDFAAGPPGLPGKGR